MNIVDRLHRGKLQHLQRKQEVEAAKEQTLWLWQFSKRTVKLCMMIFTVVMIYAMVAMWKYFDFTYLGTLISEASDIVKVGVFGYMIKSGIEHIPSSGKGSAQTSTPEPKADETAAPDGEEWEGK